MGKYRGSDGEVMGKYREVLGKYREVLGKYGEVLGKYREVLGEGASSMGSHVVVAVSLPCYWSARWHHCDGMTMSSPCHCHVIATS